MIFVSLLSLFGLVLSDNQNAQVSIPGDICICGKIVSQFDCTLANRCTWDYSSSVCNDVDCDQITDHYSCALTSQCYWNSTACNYPKPKTTLCGSISLTDWSKQNCESGNVFCTNGTSACQPKAASPSSTCTSFLTNKACLKNSLACKWEAATASSGTCQPIACANLRTQDDCLYYATTTQYTTLQLCTWANDNCVPATKSQVSKYSYNDCFINTLGTYRFSSNKIDNTGTFTGTCEPCYQIILQVILLLVALLIA